MTTLKRKFTHFVGVDVSRDTLDCAVMHGRTLLYHKQILNLDSDILQFIRELKNQYNLKLSSTVFGLEHTGIYSTHLLQRLKRTRANVVLEDSVHIRNSLGKLRGKYDKLDAIRIATYLYRTRDDIRLWEQRRFIIDELAHLMTLRFRILSTYNAMRVPLKEQADFLNPMLVKRQVEICQDSILALRNDVDKVYQAIIQTLNSDERIKRLYEIVSSVPFVGTIAAVQIIVATNEFLDITDPKKFASYSGIAPFRKESGIVQPKPRVSPVANKKVKSTLHLCAMSSVSTKSEMRTYYLRKTKEEGKPKMAALNAVRNKIIHRVFACVKNDRLYQKEYVRGSTQGA